MTKKGNPLWWIGTGFAFLIAFFTKPKQAQAAVQSFPPGPPSLPPASVPMPIPSVPIPEPLEGRGSAKVAALAEAEANHWLGYHEMSPQIQSRLVDYWRMALRGQHPESRWGKAWQASQPWSAAFVSWVANQAYPGSLRPSASHWVYTRSALSGEPGKYLAMAAKDPRAVLRRGDIVVSNRAGKNRDFADLNRLSFSPSHGDIITSVDRQAQIATGIGGNLRNSVRERSIDLDMEGRPISTSSGNSIIAVLRYQPKQGIV